MCKKAEKAKAELKGYLTISYIDLINCCCYPVNFIYWKHAYLSRSKPAPESKRPLREKGNCPPINNQDRLNKSLQRQGGDWHPKKGEKRKWRE